MINRIELTMLALLFLPLNVYADEPLDIARRYQQIVADYQRIVAAASDDAAAVKAAGAFLEAACRDLIHSSSELDELSAGDLHALGLCHETVNETPRATLLFTQSLAKQPSADCHLSLVRINLLNDLPKADDHYSRAIELNPDHSELNRYRTWLAVAHQNRRDWNAAANYWEYLLGYSKTLAEKSPKSRRLVMNHQSIQSHLDRIRRFGGMTGKPAPTLDVKHWAQGEAARLADLKGKVVLLDFCAIWTKPSRDRIDQLKTLHEKHGDKGLVIIGLMPLHGYKYDEESDRTTYQEKVSWEDQATGLAAFAKKHQIPWRLAAIDGEMVEQFGATTSPQTIALDKQGNVAAIFLGSEQSDKDLETIVGGLLE